MIFSEVPLSYAICAYQNLFSEQTHILSVMVYFFPLKKCLELFLQLCYQTCPPI